MDTVFIKMMEKAVEIQALAPKLEENPEQEWDERQGSIFWLPKAGVNGKFALFHWDNDEDCLMIGGYAACLEGAIWLPTQAQLQGMARTLHISFENPFCLLDELHRTINEYEFVPSVGGLGSEIDGWRPNVYYTQFTSMEQILSAFVLEARWHKRWNGYDWIEYTV